MKVFVDTAAVMEKPLAQAAGLGWQGKHTNLVSREFGSWLFLGAIFTTLELPRDEAEIDHCGSCRACLDICPTAAFPAPYQLDARRCISYLTIENKGPIPHEFRKAIGNRIYGCDDCLAVCPWNKFAQAGREAKLAARDELRAPPLAELARLDDAAFRALFPKSPVKRIGRDRFIRNVLIAIGNSGDASLAAEAERLLDDESRWCAARRSGRWRNWWRRRSSTRWRSATRRRDRRACARNGWLLLDTQSSCPAEAGHPVRRGLSIRSLTSLEYWIARSSAQLRTRRAMTKQQNPSCSAAMTNQPFFTKRGDAFIPNPVSNGPWDPNSMHGRVVVGLLAHVIEERHGSDEFVPARLTVDMFRLPDILTPVEVTTRLVRDGKRIKVVEAEFFSGGTSMARASCQLLRRTENAPGNVWSPSNWDAPLPETSRRRPIPSSA